jgi:aryl-alcohol dehydrogenase-like predicted oxidoreductase
MSVKYRRLGKTGLVVSVVGMGTWQFGGEWGKTFEQVESNASAADLASDHHPQNVNQAP